MGRLGLGRVNPDSDSARNAPARIMQKETWVNTTGHKTGALEGHQLSLHGTNRLSVLDGAKVTFFPNRRMDQRTAVHDADERGDRRQDFLRTGQIS